MHLFWRVGLAAGMVVLAACGGSSTAPKAAAPASSQAGSPARIGLPVEPGQTVEGLVEVGGHDLYARCSGAASPTVVYFTGWGPDPRKQAVSTIRAVEAANGGQHRICSYERRNTGRSESVPGSQSPQDVLADVDGVLAALGESGPFLLLGASFGGLVTGVYAVAHPDRVAGILLLDASIPDDYAIDERHGFTGVCLQANRDADAEKSLERIDNCALAQWAYERREREPDVPLVYLAAQDPSDRGDVADDPLRKAFVQRWSPGIWEPVSAPHWMEEAAPELVVAQLKRVMSLAG
jgi:pimeloyl-ACP methyl ester carboxylesterase